MQRRLKVYRNLNETDSGKHNVQSFFEENSIKVLNIELENQKSDVFKTMVSFVERVLILFFLKMIINFIDFFLKRKKNIKIIKLRSKNKKKKDFNKKNNINKIFQKELKNKNKKEIKRKMKLEVMSKRSTSWLWKISKIKKIKFWILSPNL